MGLGRLDSGFCCLNVSLDVSSQIIAIFTIIIGFVGMIIGYGTGNTLVQYFKIAKLA